MIESILSLEGGAHFARGDTSSRRFPAGEASSHLPAPLRSALGRPNWSLGQLLGDLELRLGLVPHTVPHGERVQRYAARLRHVAARNPATPMGA